MLDARGHVVVEDGTCDRCTVSTKHVHHREFPEIRTECGSVAAGAERLMNRLTLHREGAQSEWQRDLFDRAIAEVDEFLRDLEQIPEKVEAACRCEPRVAEPKVKRSRKTARR
jgi:hypothetical protein